MNYSINNTIYLIFMKIATQIWRVYVIEKYTVDVFENYFRIAENGNSDFNIFMSKTTTYKINQDIVSNNLIWIVKMQISNNLCRKII